MSPSVSVIIPTLNEEKNIGSCIAALEASAPAEIIVVDNASTDKTITIAKAAGARTISQKFDTIFDQILLAVEKATGDVILFLYADSRVSPSYLGGINNAIRDGFDGGSFLLKRETKNKISALIAAIHHGVYELCSASMWANRGIFVTKQFFSSVFLGEKPVGWWDENLSRTIQRKGRFKLVYSFTKTSFRLYEEMGYFKALFLVLKLYAKRDQMSYGQQTKALQDWRNDG